MNTILVSVRDTDTHFCMKAMTSKTPKYFTVYDIRMLLSADQVHTLLAFYAIRCSNNVSHFSGHVKKTIWTVLQLHNTDLIGLDKDTLTENIAVSADKLICKIYRVDIYNKARVHCFYIGQPQESLPPTSDAAKFNIMHSHYGASVWNQAHTV